MQLIRSEKKLAIIFNLGNSHSLEWLFYLYSLCFKNLIGSTPLGNNFFLVIELGMRKKFKMVMEIDEDGEERPIKIEITSKHVIRRSKVFKWEKQTALKAIEGLAIEKRLTRADIVTATTKSGHIKWKIKKGQKLIDAIEDVR